MLRWLVFSCIYRNESIIDCESISFEYERFKCKCQDTFVMYNNQIKFTNLKHLCYEHYQFTGSFTGTKL